MFSRGVCFLLGFSMYLFLARMEQVHLFSAFAQYKKLVLWSLRRYLGEIESDYKTIKIVFRDFLFRMYSSAESGSVLPIFRVLIWCGSRDTTFGWIARFLAVPARTLYSVRCLITTCMMNITL